MLTGQENRPEVAVHNSQVPDCSSGDVGSPHSSAILKLGANARPRLRHLKTSYYSQAFSRWTINHRVNKGSNKYSTPLNLWANYFKTDRRVELFSAVHLQYIEREEILIVDFYKRKTTVRTSSVPSTSAVSPIWLLCAPRSNILSWDRPREYRS